MQRPLKPTPTQENFERYRSDVLVDKAVTIIILAIFDFLVDGTIAIIVFAIAWGSDCLTTLKSESWTYFMGVHPRMRLCEIDPFPLTPLFDLH